MTIKELREYLDREESRWTDIDRECLGEFGDVTLMTLSYENGKYVGMGPCRRVVPMSLVFYF